MSTPSSKLANCAILIAVPLTRYDFFCRVQDQSDWLGKFWDPNAEPDFQQQRLDQRWNEEYFPLVADRLQALANDAQALGADVRTHATLVDLNQASASKGIVIVFAHWKGAEVANDDILANRDVFLAQSASDGSPLGKWIYIRLLRDARKCGMDDILNEALATSLSSEQTPGIVMLEDHVTRSARRRDQMDVMFEGSLRPGNRLELYDGLHSKCVVENAIAPTFSGVLDLAACNSTILASFLGGRRQYRMSTVHYPEPLDFLWAAICARGALESMVLHNIDYPGAAFQLTNQLANAVREIERQGGLITTLKTVARSVLDGAFKAGGQVAPSAKKALRTHRARQMRVFLLFLILLVASACLCAYLSLVRSDGWRYTGAVAGVGSGAALEVLRRVWRDWSRTDLLLILIEDASEAHITSLLEKLILKL
jgi:hypothetical protein